MRDEAHNSASLDAVEADSTAADETDSAASGSTVAVDTDEPWSIPEGSAMMGSGCVGHGLLSDNPGGGSATGTFVVIAGVSPGVGDSDTLWSAPRLLRRRRFNNRGSPPTGSRKEDLPRPLMMPHVDDEECILSCASFARGGTLLLVEMKSPLHLSNLCAELLPVLASDEVDLDNDNDLTL